MHSFIRFIEAHRLKVFSSKSNDANLVSYILSGEKENLRSCNQFGLPENFRFAVQIQIYEDMLCNQKFLPFCFVSIWIVHYSWYNFYSFARLCVIISASYFATYGSMHDSNPLRGKVLPYLSSMLFQSGFAGMPSSDESQFCLIISKISFRKG